MLCLVDIFLNIHTVGVNGNLSHVFSWFHIKLKPGGFSLVASCLTRPEGKAFQTVPVKTLSNYKSNDLTEINSYFIKEAMN